MPAKHSKKMWWLNCFRDLIFILILSSKLSTFGAVRTEISVNDSLVLNSIIPSLHNGSTRSGIYTEFLAKVDRLHFSGFLLVISNQMRIDSETCDLFSDIFTIELNGRWVAYSCNHYMVRYERSPLRIRIAYEIFENFSNLVTIVLTAVRFTCPLFHGHLRQCPNHPIFCIPAHLFCDSVDNCGVGADEQHCNELDQPKQIYQIEMVEEEPYLVKNFQTLMPIVLLGISTISTGTLIAVLWKNRKAKRAAERRRRNTPLYRKNAIRRTIRKIFKPEAKRAVGNEAEEETVALLTLGLKNILYTLPMDIYDEENNSRIPARSYSFSSSESI